jgi:hypothetical protein
MTDKEKEAIENIIDTSLKEKSRGVCTLSVEYLKNIKEYIQTQQEAIELLRTIKRPTLATGFKRQTDLLQAIETVLNLIKTQQEELEKKDKRISDLEFALMDMVLQFADENEDSINTMGLSALEIAFNELNFDNTMPIKEVHKRYKILAQKYYE